MRFLVHTILLLFLLAVPAALPAQATAGGASSAPSLTVDTDPVRAPAGKAPAFSGANRAERGYILHADVDEVVLNCTVLDGSQLVPNLKKQDFQVFEDGVPQTIISFQHADLPVSIALVVDNSGSMTDKRAAVSRAAMDLIEASNPEDEAFVVNFSDEAYLDQDFTSNITLLRSALDHIESRGGTALYDAVAASADKLAADSRHPKQVIILITDGDDDASTLSLDQVIRRVQQLSGPVIYSIGLLFGGDMSRREEHQARNALKELSTETGGVAFFPRDLAQVDAIAAEVARDIRNQYMLGYHSTKPASEPGFRRVLVKAHGRGLGRLTVRTRTGYFPAVRVR
ncbi:MAG: VWA domain-containing protein [Terracidiphilus sp.]